MVFLAGLVVFVALVWLPVSGPAGTSREVGRMFGRGVWVLFGALAVVGVVELSLFAVRASGESFGMGLFFQALFDTRTGEIWLARLALGLLTALAVTWAVRRRGPIWWRPPSGACCSQRSRGQTHAATEGGFLPLFAAWLHVVAACWMGGLVGFPMLLLGPLRTLELEERAKLLNSAGRPCAGSRGSRPSPSWSSW